MIIREKELPLLYAISWRQQFRGTLLLMRPLRQDLSLRIEVIKLSKSNKWCDRVSRLQILLWRNVDKLWKSKGKDMLLINTLMYIYPLCFTLPLCPS